VIHAVQEEEGAWVHTHGLCDFELAELEIRDIPRFLSKEAGSVLNEIAGYMLNSERPVRVDDLINLDPIGVVLVRRAVPRPGLVEDHYDHERWTVVDAPESMVHCELCRSSLAGTGSS